MQEIPPQTAFWQMPLDLGGISDSVTLTQPFGAEYVVNRPETSRVTMWFPG
jgi:hypothetical protein